MTTSDEAVQPRTKPSMRRPPFSRVMPYSRSPSTSWPVRKPIRIAVSLELIMALSRAAGQGGMAGGQMLDLPPKDGSNVRGPGRRAEVEPSGDEDRRVAEFGCVAGAILGQADHGRAAAPRTLWHRPRRGVSDRRRSSRPRGRSGHGRQRRPARTPPHIRPLWWGCWGRRRRNVGWTAWSSRRKRPSTPSAAMPTFSRRQRASLRHVRLETATTRTGIGGIGTAGWPRTTDLRFHRPAL